MGSEHQKIFSKGERGYCGTYIHGYSVLGQRLRNKDLHLRQQYCGASRPKVFPGFWIIPPLWIPSRDRVYAGNLCSQKPNREGKYPYDPGETQPLKPLPPDSI